ncbi:hypothetical protein ACFYVR_20185 [Rhodococcus sp. NPDC003318]|uniref:hypothetical protein n=1 Tax=Rhodococcus sp. NPDC003318 TaxID=3364503 RepID=UPI0036C87E65
MAGVAIVAIVAVAALVILLVRNSDSGGDADVAVRTPASTVTATTSAAASTAAGPVSSAASAVRDTPTNGILKVGTDIQPGEYAIRPTRSTGGYWERLSCLTGDFSCISANDIVQGSGYLTILPGDVAVRIENLELTPTGNPAPATAGSTASSAGSNSPVGGTDEQGFVDVPSARCNYTDPAIAVGQTTASLVVICETGVGRLYYKGIRLSDGAAIEIDDPVATGDGFTATNDGVQYRLSPTSLVITEGSTLLTEESVLQYWSR